MHPSKHKRSILLSKVKQQRYLSLMPVAGSLIFVFLYFIATLFYPGGSQANIHSVGFSWRNNYWCNLLNNNSINGQHNTAKPIAMMAMIVLCLSLSYFWISFPVILNLHKRLKRVIQFSGVLAMLAAFLLFTNFNHDIVTNIASAFGMIAIVATFAGLFKAKWFGLFTLGLFNIVLIAVNNYLYYTKGLLVYLPVIQKISFAFFLIWISSISLRLYRKADLLLV